MDKMWTYTRAYSPLNISAQYKLQPEDFIVKENTSVKFSGEGEHCWLYIKKRGCNTDWVAQQLAKYCGVKNMAVSYAGLKDRHAVTSQWFSVQLPGLPTPEWAAFEAKFNAGNSEDSILEQIHVIESFRHNKKIQRGALKSNSFEITLRELSGTNDEMFSRLQERCDRIAQYGVPNYFGPQRFGRNHNNLDQAEKMFTNPKFRLSRQKRGLYLSAARSWMFNKILSDRVDSCVWNKRLPGDVFMLDGKSACFKDEPSDVSQLDVRLDNNEIHPTAVLWGEGESMVTEQAEIIESQIINQYPIYRDGLNSARVQSQRRACRVVPHDFKCSRLADSYVVSFCLPPGSYATVVLAEIFSELDG